jgi:hypothetical protein
MTKLMFFIAKVAGVGLLVTACASTPGQQQSEPVKKRKSPGKTTAIVKPTGPALVKVTPPPPPPELEYGQFFERVSSSSKDFTERDRQAFLKFPVNPTAGTIHEAAIVVGILRDIVTPVGGKKTTFREVDVNAAQPGTNPSTSVIEPEATKTDSSTSFESRCREKGVDCVSALSANSYLKTYPIYTLALDASKDSGNSQAFAQNLVNTLKSETQSWGDLAKKLGMDVTIVAPVDASPEDASPDTETADVPATAEDNELSHSTMAKAVEHAAREEYEKAVIEVRKIKKGTDNYQIAQDHLKNWANRAVQDLRRQAANQYRSSSSTSEPINKKAYLEKAKGLLETAVSKFPEASTLDTVKENLDIIKKELARLK